jgi:SAM-dependent methyltransferase
MEDQRQFAPATERNRAPILDVLKPVLPPQGLVLEIASGSGQHTAFLAPHFPALTWQPSDPNPAARSSIAAWIAQTPAPNIRPPLALDASAAAWPIDRADAILCINMIHIAPWTAALGLIAGAARLLGGGGVLYLYGPYRRDGQHTAPSNAAFDDDLKARNPAWGIRDLGDVAALAAKSGFGPAAVTEMPANNLSVVFRKKE